MLLQVLSHPEDPAVTPTLSQKLRSSPHNILQSMSVSQGFKGNGAQNFIVLSLANIHHAYCCQKKVT